MKPVVVVILAIVFAAGSSWIYSVSQSNKSVADAEGSDLSAAASERPAPLYLPMDPPFLVNFEMEGQLRFLQVSVEVMAHDEQAMQSLQIHMPHLRNNILMILSDQTLATVLSRESKQTLRSQILIEIQKVMAELTGRPGVEAVYFTNFVMQ